MTQSVAERLREWRKREGHTLRTAAAEITRLAKCNGETGVSHNLIALIESEQVGVTAKTARKLARALRCRWTTLCS